MSMCLGECMPWACMCDCMCHVCVHMHMDARGSQRKPEEGNRPYRPGDRPVCEPPILGR